MLKANPHSNSGAQRIKTSEVGDLAAATCWAATTVVTANSMEIGAKDHVHLDIGGIISAAVTGYNHRREGKAYAVYET